MTDHGRRLFEKLIESLERDQYEDDGYLMAYLDGAYQVAGTAVQVMNETRGQVFSELIERSDDISYILLNDGKTIGLKEYLAAQMEVGDTDMRSSEDLPNLDDEELAAIFVDAHNAAEDGWGTVAGIRAVRTALEAS